MNITRVLCPTDFSDASAHAIDLAVTIARWYKARVAAVHVVDDVVIVPGFDSSPGGALDVLRATTASNLSAASSAGVEVDVFLDAGSPAARILDRAAALPADLIVMGTHGGGGFQHLLLGSVTERVLRRAVCPVITVPPRQHSTSRVPFRRVLCAIDFSESSMAALQLALSLAEESDATLTLLHVLEWPWEEPPPPRMEDLPFEQRAALGEYRRYREKMASMRLDALFRTHTKYFRPLGSLSQGKARTGVIGIVAGILR